MTGKDALDLIKRAFEHKGKTVPEKLNSMLSKNWSIPLAEDDLNYIEEELFELLAERPMQEDFKIPEEMQKESS